MQGHTPIAHWPVSLSPAVTSHNPRQGLPADRRDQTAKPNDTNGGRLWAEDTFHLTLENFSGPFELLLSLINRRQLDVTEIALAQVTDEFVAHIRAQDKWQLDEASEFLVIAATLLDLKTARLLPSAEVESAEDLELLEARDLLFARLLQYRAYKEVAQWLTDRFEEQSKTLPRIVPLELEFAQLLPELIWRIGPTELAALAAEALAPKTPPTVDLTHLHNPVVSVREQAAVIVERLRRVRILSFRDLVADASNTTTVVARFLALLELYREQAIAFEQAAPLADLTVRWTGADQGDVELDIDYDDGMGTNE